MYPHKRWSSILFVTISFIVLLANLVRMSTSAGEAGPADQPESSSSNDGAWTVFFPGFQVGQLQGFIQHNGKLIGYNGAKTCLECHQEEVGDFGASNHYLWEGKFGALNDFCGLADINFGPAKLTTVNGTQVDGGCAKCHAGMGEKPTASNPENADCLVCHAADYRRTAVYMGGAWRFQPNRAGMPATITIQEEPTRFACLTCHAYSGGGGNNKRGDLSDVLADPTRSQDVHMSSGMTCVDCHLSDGNHHIAGRGADLLVDEGVAMRQCDSCHANPAGFHPEDVASHLDRVACQSCHIPAFARAVSTDMLRDFRAVELTSAGLYEPAITRQANVIPEYAFWNGESGFYEFNTPAVPDQVLAWPLGDIQDGKLYPFKLHRAVQPQDPVSKAILPLKAGILFQTGNLEQAILVGAQESGIPLTQGYSYLDTQRWMGIFHEMPPAEQVLSCDSCHEANGRMDFDALGYTPKNTRQGRPLCISCHESEENKGFYELHHKHVEDKDIACSECHNFSR